jgi:hypothetical protein
MATSKEQVSKYTAESTFIFVGKVIKTKAATMKEIAADNTAVVQVERVITAPDMFTSLTGAQITVRFKKPAEIKKGDTLTIFANGWIFGSSLAVDAVGTIEETDKVAMTPMVRNALVASNDSVLRARLDSAEMAVAGKVSKVAKREVEPSHISEHDPNWQEATINVDEVIKGKKDVKQVTLLFPGSDDVRWHQIGKYTTGQQGIFLLQRGEKQDPTGIPPKILAAVPAGPEVLTTLHSADYLPLHELERVKALVRK